uniref:Uncharacterized protein n=1 Tax=Leptomonas pyrrhocoris qin-like virus TaxID=3070844 RepID=A0AA50Q5F9_9VIRU|nr:hypothetical protein [Leptomonas pyrrhocoris qin-like virus]
MSSFYLIIVYLSWCKTMLRDDVSETPSVQSARKHIASMAEKGMESWAAFASALESIAKVTVKREIYIPRKPSDVDKSIPLAERQEIMRKLEEMNKATNISEEKLIKMVNALTAKVVASDAGASSDQELKKIIADMTKLIKDQTDAYKKLTDDYTKLKRDYDIQKKKAELATIDSHTRKITARQVAGAASACAGSALLTYSITKGSIGIASAGVVGGCGFGLIVLGIWAMFF